MIYSSSFIISSPDVAQCPQNALPEYAFVGRSNVGKSSLINMLTNHAGLAKTSQKPGKTLLINHFAIHGTTDWQLVDLPGYGYAQQGKRQRERLRQMIERYCLLRTALTNLFVLIDSRHAPQQIDLDFITWLGENAVPFAIVFTKIDKISQTALAQNVAAYENTLRETWEELPPMFVSSAAKKMGCDELLKYIEEINERLKSE